MLTWTSDKEWPWNMINQTGALKIILTTIRSHLYAYLADTLWSCYLRSLLVCLSDSLRIRINIPCPRPPPPPWFSRPWTAGPTLHPKHSIPDLGIRDCQDFFLPSPYPSISVRWGVQDFQVIPVTRLSSPKLTHLHRFLQPLTHSPGTHCLQQKPPILNSFLL